MFRPIALALLVVRALRPAASAEPKLDDSWFAVQMSAAGHAPPGPGAAGESAAYRKAAAAADAQEEEDEEDTAVAVAMASAEAEALADSARFPLDDALGKGARISKKFYVYDDLDWLAMTCNGQPVMDTAHEWVKHTDDFWFLKAAMNSTWRTGDPEEAELFVVPAMLNMISETLAYRTWVHCCVGNLCGYGLAAHAEQALATSKWFQRLGGKDHVVVCSHYACRRQLRMFASLDQCNSISFEENSRRGGRCRLASTYVGQRCKHTEKRYELAMVARMHPEKVNFASRRDVCSWTKQASAEQPQLFSYECCGECGRMCPALAEAKFGLHVRGDTFGANRLIDTILSGTVPLFTAPEQYDILPSYVPWKNLSALVNLSSKRAFMDGVAAAEKRYDALKRAVDAHKHKVNWQTSIPFERYMGMFERCAPK